MNKHTILATLVLTLTLFTGCDLIRDIIDPRHLEINVQQLNERIYNPTRTPHDTLQSSTVLYLDHSTCVIDAVKDSQVFKALRPNLGQYCDTLKLIKGVLFESIPLNRQDNKVSAVLSTMNNDIPFADLRKAIFQICNQNQQAILISDCESYANGRFLDLEAYMSEPFRDWLKNGHTIYIITEPYKERFNGKTYDKNRFYMIFTDDRMEAPIGHNMLGEIQSLLQSNVCSLYKMTNSDITVQTPKSDVVDENLDFKIEYCNGFEYISIENSWKQIGEYVMKLDKYDEPLPEEEPVPFIKNLSFADGENYSIDDIRIKATNITGSYLSVEDSTIEAKDIDISEGFILDKNAFQNHKLNVMLTNKIFTEGYLSDEFGGNLIRLDFMIKEVSLKPYDHTKFEWQCIWSPNQAICVSKSIDNALRDINVIPKGRIIHTVFIKTEISK